MSEGDCRLLELEAVLAIYEEEVEVSMDEDNLLSYRIKLDDIGAVLSLKLSGKLYFLSLVFSYFTCNFIFQLWL